MPLLAGTPLGPYKIIAPLGAGGMGEVYRARDTRLGRDVAIKALPAAFAQDPERLARFEREAKLLASLSHPNIAGIHGLQEVAGARYLVLEFVEGETLAAHIARGPLPVREAIEICGQIAAGVEAAHERGVVHRDLKPGNIMLTPSGAVKVLDFGLAKANGPGLRDSDPDLSASPTLTLAAATSAGVVLGTAAYMSPEQARGKSVDRRTDVWSFGCILYECLTGRQAFQGDTVSDLIARILEREPDWDALPPATPPRIVGLLRRCLTKDPVQRLRDIGEARIALTALRADEGRTDPDARADRRAAPRWIVPALVAALAVAVTSALLLAIRPSHPGGPLRRFRVAIPGLTMKFLRPMALTRDGQWLAYEANDRIWARRLDRSEAVEVPGSIHGRSPFWSWDETTLCFAASKKLWSFTPGGDEPRELCDIPESGEIVGGAWSADGRIVLAVWRGGLYELPAGGGEVRQSLPIDSSTVDFHGPSFLPDGHTLLLLVHDKRDRNAVAIVEGNPPRLKRVYDAPRWVSVSYSSTGHLLGSAVDAGPGSEIWAVPFSVGSKSTSGTEFRVMTGAGSASASSDGLLVALVGAPSPMGQLVWLRRDGSVERIGEPQQGITGPSLSPDGKRVAYAAEHDGNSDVWVQDLERGTKTRLTSSPLQEEHPSWSPDGARLFYASEGDVGHASIVAIASDGSGSPDTVAHGYQPVVSPDGRTLAFIEDRKGRGDLWVLTLGAGGVAKPFLATAADENGPAFSPDGRWMAYSSDETGRSEVYLRRFPEGDAPAQVSVGGGSWPRWTRRGDGICYAKQDTLMLVPVGAGPRPALGLPRRLFSTSAPELELSASIMRGVPPVDAHPDGERFIAVQQIGPPAPQSLLFVENWFEEFRKR